MLNLSKLEEMIRDSGLAFKTRSKSWIFTCPRCLKQDKLYIRRSDGRFVCWFCKNEGYQGRPEYALTDLLGQPVSSIQAQLYGSSAPGGLLFNPKLGDFCDIWDEDDVIELEESLETVEWPLDYYPIEDWHSKRGLEYLEGRGITLDIAQEYGIRYCPQRRRVVFPVEVDKKLVGWQERLVVNHRHFDEDLAVWMESPKAITKSGMRRDSVLMYGDRIEGSDHVVLCEGPVDAIKAHLCCGNVATLGKAVSPKQVELIKNSGVKKVYLGLDPDAAKEMQRLSREFIMAGIECYDMRPAAKDLGAMSLQEVYDLFLRAKRVSSGQIFVYFNS